MKRINNKGFAVSTVLYGLLIVFFLVITLLMSIISTNRKSTVKLSEQIEEELNSYSKKRVKHGTPNPPELVTGMIAVTYDDAKSAWVKANTEDGSWYNYNEQKWANAVTVTSTNRSKYLTAPAGEVVSMNDINTMWVWIPRYSYKKNGDNFDIKWIKYSSIDKDISSYYTSSAFCFGDTCDTSREDPTNKELTGIWIAKFEVSPDNSNCQNNDEEANCNKTNIPPKIKPNEISWRNATISSFYTSINTQMNGTNGATKYGLQTNYDAHMIKNIEWGAAAYLSQSIYGKFGNNNYTETKKEVTINNCSLYYTGIGSATNVIDEYCTNSYETKIGQSSSTTGNIYGIYDMSGGSFEYVMGNVVNEKGKNYVGSPSGGTSGFSGITLVGNTRGIPFPSKKYYNSYTYNTVTARMEFVSILGDATEETSGMYQDAKNPITIAAPWYTRGGAYNSLKEAGIFSYLNRDGGTNGEVSTRATIISTK